MVHPAAYTASSSERINVVTYIVRIFRFGFLLVDLLILDNELNR